MCPNVPVVLQKLLQFCFSLDSAVQKTPSKYAWLSMIRFCFYLWVHGLAMALLGLEDPLSLWAAAASRSRQVFSPLGPAVP